MFGHKKANAKKDEVTKHLLAGGVYSMGRAPHQYVPDHETAQAIRDRKIYSFWYGVWYVVILSLALFWIPPFGQMVAGYVGGRKTGSAWKGFLAALLPMCFVFLLFGLAAMGIFDDQIGWVFDAPLSGANYLGEHVPVMGSLVVFMTTYIQEFAGTLGLHGRFYVPYVLTIVLGYVGGALSELHQRELGQKEQNHLSKHPKDTGLKPEEKKDKKEKDKEDTGEKPEKKKQKAMVIGKAEKKKGFWQLRKDKKKPKWD
jgi:hypothetical protein